MNEETILQILALNEVEVAWLRTEISKCIAANTEDYIDAEYHRDTRIEAEGRIQGLKYVEYLLDIAMFDVGSHGRVDGPRYGGETE
jgi:hypothetical protein